MNCSLLLLLTGTVCGILTVSGARQCSIRRYGKLTLFNGEQHSLELPCKYRLADFTCGDYRAIVTATSAVDGRKNNRFSPTFTYVRIVGPDQSYGARTSDFLVKQVRQRGGGNPWTDRVGELTLDYEGYRLNQQVAVVRKGPLKVEFTEKATKGDDAGIVVTCNSDHFSSTGLPTSLCGDGNTSMALRRWKAEEYGCGTLVTFAQALHHIVLSDDRLTQSPQCQDMAAKFQSCDFKENAITWCEAILGHVSLAGCLAESTSPLQQFYLGCLQYACDGVESATSPLRSHVNSTCPDHLDLVPLDVCLI